MMVPVRVIIEIIEPIWPSGIIVGLLVWTVFAVTQAVKTQTSDVLAYLLDGFFDEGVVVLVAVRTLRALAMEVEVFKSCEDDICWIIGPGVFEWPGVGTA
jgi:hypothetical protein